MYCYCIVKNCLVKGVFKLRILLRVHSVIPISVVQNCYSIGRDQTRNSAPPSWTLTKIERWRVLFSHACWCRPTNRGDDTRERRGLCRGSLRPTRLGPTQGELHRYGTYVYYVGTGTRITQRSADVATGQPDLHQSFAQTRAQHFRSWVCLRTSFGSQLEIGKI